MLLLERAVGSASPAQELVARDLEVTKVVAVVDHPHLIGVAVDDAHAGDLGELGRNRHLRRIDCQPNRGAIVGFGFFSPPFHPSV
jgi:hypothetical protein